MYRSLVACLLILLPFLSPAQQFGGTPLSVKWKQINTDTARIIYPAGLDSQAQRVASLVHYQALNQSVPAGNQLKKVNIVLQNQTTISNGYVGLGPFRSEFYMTPRPNSFELGSISWTDQLALHEYRHVQQFNNFRHGLSNLMYYLFGQEGYALAINAAVPDWLYEGDAVYNETILTPQGRGRLPLFMNAYPSLWQADKHYSWMKLRNGSLKDYVPNHYNLGYLLVNYGRQQYGLDFWSKVTTDASAFKGLFYPFQKAVKKYAGVDYKEFTKEALAYYQQQMTAAEAQRAQDTAIREVNPVNTKAVTDYLFPYAMSDNSLLYLKRGYNRRPAFFIKDEEGERWFRVKSISIDDQYSYRNGKVVYAAYENDARWSWRDYSVIRLLDINTRTEKRITSRSRYFTPDISPGGTKIAAVQVTATGQSALHILDAETGEIKNKIAAAEISLFGDPKFISDDSLVYAIRQRDGKMALAITDLRRGDIHKITPASFNVIGYPCVDDHVIYFTASYGGNDQLYALQLPGEEIFRLTNLPLGSYYVNVANGKMTWSYFTAEGYQLRQMDTKDIVREPVSPDVINDLIMTYPVSHQKDVQEIESAGHVLQRNFPVKKYNKDKNLLNFHSWRPYYEDPEFTFSLYGENILNTMQTQLYYLYNENEKTSAVGASAVYGKWFPYLSAGYQYTFGRKARVDSARYKQWDESDIRVGINVPLSWIRGRGINRLNTGVNYYYRKDVNSGFYKDTFPNVQFSYLQYFVNWGQEAESAIQHIYPRLGYNVSLQYRHAITQYNTWQWLATGALYLPGVLPSHSVVATGAFQETDTLQIPFASFSNRMPYSRGYNAAYFSRMWRLSFNYHFPLFYPDWGFGNIFYLQRVRANAFYDLTRVYSLNKAATANQRSTGGEIYFDTKWWNQYTLTFGARVSYIIDRDFYSGQSRTPVFEIIMPVSILPR